MKKFLLILLALLLCAGMACAEGAVPTATPAPTPVPDMIVQSDATRRPIQTATPRPADAPLPEDTFLGHAVEITRRLGLMAESDVYFAYCNRSGATRARWDAVSRGDHMNPARIFSLSGSELLRGLTNGQPENAPWFDMSRPELRRDIVGTLPDMMFIGMDREDVSLIKMLARYKIYAADVPDDCGLLIMLYEDGTPIVCYWYSNAGAVSISAFFMPDEALEACASPDDVSAWFAALGMPVVTFEEVTW